MIVGRRGTKTLEPIEGCGTRWKQELDPRGICNFLAQSKGNDPSFQIQSNAPTAKAFKVHYYVVCF